MNTFKFESGPGDRFDETSAKAKAIAENRKVVVEFDFNGIACLVSSETNLQSLYRDYGNAHIMEWKSVGPDCSWRYDIDTEIELLTRQLKQAKDRKAQCEELECRDEEQRKATALTIEGIEFSLLDGKQEEYVTFREKNTADGYSAAVVEYAETWARVMQLRLSVEGKAIPDIADDSQDGLGYLGISGFQYGCVVNTLAKFWVHGEELRKWHNTRYGVSEEKGGVVNPAVLTLKTN